MRYYWHKFHDELFTNGFSKPNRIVVIKREKSNNEIPLRLKLFKYSPTLTKYLSSINPHRFLEFEDLSTTQQKHVLALHRKECKNCPWENGTIFHRKNENGIWY